MSPSSVAARGVGYSGSPGTYAFMTAYTITTPSRRFASGISPERHEDYEQVGDNVDDCYRERSLLGRASLQREACEVFNLLRWHDKGGTSLRVYGDGLHPMRPATTRYCKERIGSARLGKNF